MGQQLPPSLPVEKALLSSPKSVKDFKPLIWLTRPPTGRWKFKVPQGPIKLSPHLLGGRIPCMRDVNPIYKNVKSFWKLQVCAFYFHIHLIKKNCLKIMKNAFYFTKKSSSILEKLKFLHFSLYWRSWLKINPKICKIIMWLS